MLVITDEQLKALDNTVFDQFIDNIYQEISAVYPELSSEYKNLKTIVDKQAKRAMEQYDIQTTKWLFTFVLLSLQHKSLQEKEYPEAIEDALTWPDRTEENKIKVLNRILNTNN